MIDGNRWPAVLRFITPESRELFEQRSYYADSVFTSHTEQYMRLERCVMDGPVSGVDHVIHEDPITRKRLTIVPCYRCEGCKRVFINADARSTEHDCRDYPSSSQQ